MSEFRKEDLSKFETLVKVVERLRSPDGCPWDREQTSRTLRQFAVEEAYEVVEAIDADDLDRLREELGDLLLQIILHARIAEESGAFTIDDVIEGITEKLIRRHVWVFGGETAESPEAALRTWNRIKVDEKGGAENGASILDGVPRVSPALFKAFAITRRAAQVGFDWQAAKDLFAKIKEELHELEETLPGGSGKRTEEELGDLLFVMANLARHLDINPELALEGANRKFIRRFRYIEQRLAEKGRTPHDASLEEMDALWDEFKQQEKKSDQPE